MLPHKPRDLSKFGCHSFQYMVWRNSGESRHLVAFSAYLIFCIYMHICFATHISYVNYLVGNEDRIEFVRSVAQGRFDLPWVPTASEQESYSLQWQIWNQRLSDFTF